MKRTTITIRSLWARIRLSAALLFIVSSLVLGSVLPGPVNAGTASKSIVESGPFAPGDEVTVQIMFTKPTIPVSPSVEMVIVVDTSGSIASYLPSIRQNLRDFLDNQLQFYPGAVRVGITKIGNGTAGFDSDPTDDYKHAENAKMFATGTTNPYANSTVGYNKVVTIDGSNIDDLRAAINAIKEEPVNNPISSPNGVNSYTSDIGAGLNRAKGMFTTDSTTKFVMLITDGFANKSYCPLTSTGAPAVAFPAGTIMQLVPAGTEYGTATYIETEYRNEDPSFPLSYPYTYGEPGVCKPFISNLYPAGLQSVAFTTQIVNRYDTTGRNKKSTDITNNILDDVIQEAKANSATIDDFLNPNVFDNVTSWGGLFNCDTGSPGTQYTGNSWYPSGTNAKTVVPQGNLDKASKFCVRFKAHIKAGAAGGTSPINTSGNLVTYKDKAGNVLATDTIAPGSISINSDVNLQPDSFVLTDAAGNPKTTFAINEPIYVRTNVKNIGTDSANSGSETRFYRNAPNALPKSDPMTPEMWLIHGGFGGGTSYEYGSYPGGTKEANFQSSSGLNYWTVATPGTYVARAYVNYKRDDGPTYETIYTDNQAKVTYNVIAPSDLTVTKFDTVDTSGAIKYVFNRNEAIYAKITAANIGSYATQTAVQTQVYANKPSTVAVGTISDTTPNPMYIQHGLIGAGSSYLYGSYPGGNFEGAYNGQKSWTVSGSTGVLTARAYINFDQSEAETNYNNNQFTKHYGVIVPPTGLTANVTSCRNVTLSWTNGAGIENYRVHITNTTKGTSTDDVTANSPLLKNLEDGPNSYQWSLYPQLTIDGIVREGAPVSGGTFSTQPCPHFAITVPSPVVANPGGPTAIENISIDYLGTNAYWNASTDNVTLRVRGMYAGIVDCKATLPVQGTKHSGSLNGLTAQFQKNSDTTIDSAAPTTSQVTLNLSASATATLGQYTVCIGTWSNASTDQDIKSLVVNVDMLAWLQVGGPTDGVKGAGDVHSNGPIGNMVIPSNPVQQYFFRTSSIGILSSSNDIGINPLTFVSSYSQDWLSKTYPATSKSIQSPHYAYATMLADASRNQTLTSLPANQSLINDLSCNNGKSGTFRVSGNAVLDNGKDIHYPAGCNGVSLVFFVDGNLAVHDNMIDQTNSGTITFIVNGDITVDSDVSVMDGMYLFGGRFSDGSSATQLTVHGSLLGLPGDAASTNTGSFTLSGGASGLQRDLGAANNKSTPAELIYYQPKYLYMLQTSALSGSTFSWTE